MPADNRPKRKQSPAEQLSIAMRWNAELGGKVIPMTGTA